jgi:DNA polymerase-4
LEFDPIWSVAANKLVAKVASRTVKPNGESIVEPGTETAFLAPLSLHLIPGIEPEDLGRLRDFNLASAGQLARLSPTQLAVAFGNRSRVLYEAVHGIDPSPVLPVGQGPSVVGAEHTFGTDTNDTAVVDGILYRLVEQIGAGLRRRRLAARRVGITLDYADGGRITRQAAARPATAGDPGLFTAARVALHRAWVRRVRVRNLRVICDRLTYPPAQLDLFVEDAAAGLRHDRLMTTLDAIRRRFGPEAVSFGRTMGVGLAGWVGLVS